MSDWSSDVCSSDLHRAGADAELRHSRLELDGGAARRPADPRPAARPAPVREASRHHLWTLRRPLHRQHLDAPYRPADSDPDDLAGEPAEALSYGGDPCAYLLARLYLPPTPLRERKSTRLNSSH